MNKHILTRSSARRARSYYSDDQLATLIPHGGLTPSQVASMGIITRGRQWLLIHAMSADDATLRLHAVWCARRALALLPNPDPRSVAAVDVAERFALGEDTSEELAAARHAARSAEREAGGRIARDVAVACAWAAGTGLKLDGAWDAACNVACDAAGEAAGEAERSAQVQDLASRLS